MWSKCRRPWHGHQKEHNSGVKIIKRSAREGKDREGNRKKKKKIGSIKKEKKKVKKKRLSELVRRRRREWRAGWRRFQSNQLFPFTPVAQQSTNRQSKSVGSISCLPGCLEGLY